MEKLTDSFGRVHDYLRISLTDKCNLNCSYCNPAVSSYNKMHRNDLLTFDELIRLINIFGMAGIKKIRFTGGEPLARKDVFEFFNKAKKLKEKFNFQLGITTNGTLLNNNVKKLKDSGIDRLNISIDSLQNEKFYKITKQDKLDVVLAAVDEALEIGFCPVKVNTVLMNGINDDEITEFVDYAVNKNINVRFIEYMPFGNNNWQADYFLGWGEIKSIVEEKYNLIPYNDINSTVSKDFLIKDNPGSVSFISSISDHFCSSCNRLRITAEGKLKLCLFTNGVDELDFKELLNNNISDKRITELMQDKLKTKNENHPPTEELLAMERNNMLSIGG